METQIKSHKELWGKDADNPKDLWVGWRKQAGRTGRVVWDSSVDKTQTYSVMEQTGKMTTGQTKTALADLQRPSQFVPGLVKVGKHLALPHEPLSSPPHSIQHLQCVVISKSPAYGANNSSLAGRPWPSSKRMGDRNSIGWLVWRPLF